MEDRSISDIISSLKSASESIWRDAQLALIRREQRLEIEKMEMGGKYDSALNEKRILKKQYDELARENGELEEKLRVCGEELEGLREKIARLEEERVRERRENVDGLLDMIRCLEEENRSICGRAETAERRVREGREETVRLLEKIRCLEEEKSERGEREVGGETARHLPENASLEKDKRRGFDEAENYKEVCIRLKEQFQNSNDNLNSSNAQARSRQAFDDKVDMESQLDPGPGDQSVLYLQTDHRSSDIWHGQHWRQEEQAPIVQEDASSHESDNSDGDDSLPSHRYTRWRRHGAARQRDIRPRLTREHPGGPTDPSILMSIEAHICTSIWQGEERPMLMVHHRKGQLDKWRIPRPGRGSHAYPLGTWPAYVHGTGLAHLGDVMHRHYDAPLIAAFVERWHPETNSFHMPFGEMTIMLHDVLYILGLPIEGRIVTTGTEPKPTDVAHILARTFSMEQTAVLAQLQALGGMLKTKTLEQARNDGALTPRNHARAFLLQLLSSTLFVDKSRDKVDPLYIILLRDLDAVHSYAWGAAVLAYLYRQLGIASRSECKQIAGCLTLLQAWIYEYFADLRAPLTLTGDIRLGHEFARAARWDPPQLPHGQDMERLRRYRYYLDRMSAEMVIWTPYGHLEWGGRVRHKMSTFHGIIQCLGITEPYMPARCIRQLGYVQCIPSQPFMPRRARRTAQVRDYSVEFNPDEAMWNFSNAHCISREVLGRRALHGWEQEPNYAEWYRSVSHVQIQGQDHCEEAGYSKSYAYDPCTRCHAVMSLLGPYQADWSTMDHKQLDRAMRLMTMRDPVPWIGVPRYDYSATHEPARRSFHAPPPTYEGGEALDEQPRSSFHIPPEGLPRWGVRRLARSRSIHVREGSSSSYQHDATRSGYLG